MEAANATSHINLCEFVDRQCNIYDFIVHSFTNAASIVINALHLLVLLKIPRVRESNYFWILLNLTLGDVAMSLAVILLVNCNIWYSRNCFIIVGSYAFGGCAFQVRYWLLTLAVLDRYYAVCKPFQYTTSKFINNIGKLAAVAWLLCAILASALNILNHFRLDPVLSEITNYLRVVLIITAVLPSVVSTVLLIRIAVELQRMKQLRNMSVEDQETRSATRYIIFVFVMFYVSLVPSLVNAGMGPGNSFTWLPSLALFTHFLYGIGNVVLYGVLNKAYVAKIKSICGSLCPVRKVSPQ